MPLEQGASTLHCVLSLVCQKQDLILSLDHVIPKQLGSLLLGEPGSDL